MDTTNRFIQFEGMDGSGKTTIIQRLASIIAQRGKPVAVIRLPGGVVSLTEDLPPLSSGGELVREFFLSNRKHFDSDSAMMLSLAAYRDNLIKVVRPVLDLGGYVLCDRGIASIGAYHPMLMHSNQVPAMTLVGHQDYLLEHQYPSIAYLDIDFPTSLSRQGNRGNVDSEILDIKEQQKFDEIRSNILRTTDTQSALLNGRFFFEQEQIGSLDNVDNFLKNVLIPMVMPEIKE